MALVKCPECGRLNVSDTATACPGCGCNIFGYYQAKRAREAAQRAKDIEKTQEYRKLENRLEELRKELDSLKDVRPKPERRGDVIIVLGFILSIILSFYVGFSVGFKAGILWGVVSFFVTYMISIFLTIYVVAEYEKLPRDDPKWSKKMSILSEMNEIENKMYKMKRG